LPGLFGFLTLACVQHYGPNMGAWQIGRPDEFGDDSGGLDPPKVRDAFREAIASVRRSDRPVSLWAAASPPMLADVLSEGPVLAGADGVSLSLDADARAPSLRSGAYRRSLDWGKQIARRLGVARIEVGATGDDPDAATPQQVAWKLVTRHVLALAEGAERVFVSPGRGIPTPRPAAVAYAWMTHLLDAATYRTNLWPDVPLLEGHLFSGPDQQVAVIWSWVGQNPDVPDRGALVFENGHGLEALDVVGRPVGIWKGPRLVVPLGEAPVYVVSRTLTAAQMQDRFRHARVVGLDPATLWLHSLTWGQAPGRVRVTVWIQSHRPYRAGGMVGLVLPEGWRARQSKYSFALDPGEARPFTFECDVSQEAGPPPYRIEAVALMDDAWVRRTQDLQFAQAAERTITVGDGLADWEGIEPVRLSAKPARQRAAESGETHADVWTAWDKKFFYFAAAVYRSRATFHPGRHAFDGDAIQLAWGLGNRADDDFGRRGRGQALPAGVFRDTDHLLALAFGPDGAQVIRLRGPHVAFRTHLPGNMDPWYGPVEGAEAAIGRDEEHGVTIYESAIPWKALAPLAAQRGREFRFAFRIGDWPAPPLEWAWTAGMPDYLANPASFLPTSEATLPCQTRWALGGPKPPGAAEAE